MDDIVVYKSHGQLLGFIRNGNLYSPFGEYLGWKEGDHVWDAQGQYRGALKREANGHNYIMRYIFDLAPIPQYPRIVDNLSPSELPRIQPHIEPIQFSILYVDGWH